MFLQNNIRYINSSKVHGYCMAHIAVSLPTKQKKKIFFFKVHTFIWFGMMTKLLVLYKQTCISITVYYRHLQESHTISSFG